MVPDVHRSVNIVQLLSVVARYKVESVPNVVNVQECNDSIECNFHIRKNNLNVLIKVNVESTVIIKL